MNRGRQRFFLVAVIAMAAGSTACEAFWPSVGSIELRGPTEITGPGVVRLYVDVRGSGGDVVEDDIEVSVATTGPFTATMESANQPWFRVVRVTASAPGSGTVRVAARNKSATVELRAVDVKFKTVATTDGFGCGIATDDRAWCWGGNLMGQLGVETTGKCYGSACQYGGNDGNTTPLAVAGDRKFSKVAVSGNYCQLGPASGTCGGTCAIAADGKLSCWGSLRMLPVVVIGPTTTFMSVNVVPAGSTETPGDACGLLSDGKPWCFRRSLPAGSWTFSAFRVGRFHSCGIVISGDVYCWGSNAHGALGLGYMDAVAHATPERVEIPAQLTSLALSEHSTCALATTGTIYCWGQGYSAAGAAAPAACPGNPYVLCDPTPRALTSGTAYTSLARSEASPLVCGLTAAGEVDCWTTLNGSPIRVPVPEPMANISSYCGVSVTNVAWCWTPTSAVKLIR